MRTLPLSQAKAHLSQLADEVDRTHERVVVTKNGRNYVVLMSVEDLEAIEETLALLADPEAQARLQEAREGIAHGDFLTDDQMLELMRERHRREGGR